MLSVRSILARHLRASSHWVLHQVPFLEHNSRILYCCWINKSKPSKNSNKIIYTGDQLWYSVRGGALNASAGGFGGDSILRERIDFWEDTIYGHGGDAKIWAGLTHDHDKFKDDEVGELGPVQRTLPLRAGNEAESEEAVETDEGAELEEKIMEFKRWCRVN